MNKGLKITLITVGSLALVGGITYAIVRSIRKSRKAKEELEKELIDRNAFGVKENPLFFVG